MGDAKYDYLVVGAGLAGATFAWAARQLGKSVLVIDRRDHVAGNCHTRRVESIDVHVYGPHLFHTNSKRIWDFVNRFAEFNDYHHVVVAKTSAGMLSLPINLYTLSRLFGIETPGEARRYFEKVRVADADVRTVEGWCLANIGRQLYELLIEGYTVKQWGTHPSALPAGIVERLPVRLTFDPRYFSDAYQGVPKCGYTELVARMLDGIDVSLDTDYLDRVSKFRRAAGRVVYTGPVDALFGYDAGRLPYRSIRTETEVLDVDDHQGVGQVNYTSAAVPWTRVIEHKHFCATTPGRKSVVSKEFASSEGEPYYPIANLENTALARAYAERARAAGYILVGRMANYMYYDMHVVIAQALKVAEAEFGVGIA